MLESAHDQVAAGQTEVEAFSRAVKQLKFRVQLTSGLKQSLQRKGPVPTVDNDKRQFVRFYCSARGILYCRQSLPAIFRATSEYLVLVTNLSRGGLCFVHQDQLFPRERLSVWVESKRKLDIEITRCRMINEKCYEVGAKFV